MQELEELLQKPEIYENLSLFKEFLKGVKKLCDQFEEKIKMVPKQEFQEETRIKKKIEKQIIKRKKKKDNQGQLDDEDKDGKQQSQFDNNGNQIEKLNLLDVSMVEIQDLNKSGELEIISQKKSKKIKPEVKREEEDAKGMQEEDSFGGNIVYEYQ
ncbi:unnamed protein product [Paramecium pentaurelia]|uniref:Uncharacterized protein n=1 Tax=Paramecium pentaurelia TaxID=43138 RepID=A0A8S1WKE6_9CILI|nr:unnamed protein product [Paramecium pentaurelia]